MVFDPDSIMLNQTLPNKLSTPKLPKASTGGKYLRQKRRAKMLKRLFGHSSARSSRWGPRISAKWSTCWSPARRTPSRTWGAGGGTWRCEIRCRGWPRRTRRRRGRGRSSRSCRGSMFRNTFCFMLSRRVSQIFFLFFRYGPKRAQC